MKYAVVVAMVTLFALRVFAGDPAEVAGPRWPAEKAWQWYNQQPWLCGFNYIPATAINYTEMWQKETFDPKTIDEELALAEQVQFNSLRCVLQYLVWEHDPEGLKQRMDQFLVICHRHGIRVVFCLFDDCVFGPKHDPYLGKQAEAIPGWYAHDWSPSPGWSRVKDPEAWPKLERYVKDILTRFKDDPRVLLWDLYNEPTNGIGDATLPLLAKVVDRARQANPSQPLTVGVWNGNRLLNDLAFSRSDVVSFHNYSKAPELERKIAELQGQGRPILCTEWLNRPHGSVVETCLPVFERHHVGCLSWGLVNGKTQTQYPWGSKAGAPEPKVWQHDLFRKDRTPYDPNEIELFMQAIARSQREALRTVKEIQRYADRSRSILPKGWSLQTGQAELKIVRDEPVEWYNPISLPYHRDLAELKVMGFVHQSKYVITLAFAPPIAPAELEKMRAENAKTSAALAKLKKTMNPFWGKGHYDPRNDDERKLVAEHDKLKASLHRIPDFTTADASVFLSDSIGYHVPNGYLPRFYSDAVAAECMQVRQAAASGAFEK